MLPKNMHPFIIDGTNIIDDLLETKIIFSMFIMDARTILNLKANVFKDIKQHHIFKDLPILAYSNNDSFEIKSKLYSLGVRGVINSEFNKITFANYVDRIFAKSNHNIGSNRDRFIKSLISYEHCKEGVDKAIYLANYLIHHYKINNLDALCIRDSVALLIISHNRNNLRDTITLIENMNISEGLEGVMQNYFKPKTLRDNIILSTLLLNSSEFKMNLDKFVDFNTIDHDVYDLAQDANNKSKIIIDSYKDINNFWSMISERLVEDEQFSLKDIDQFLHKIFIILNRALVSRGGLYAELDKQNTQDYLFVKLEPFNCNIENVEQYIADMHSDSLFTNFQYEETSTGVEIHVKLHHTIHNFTEPSKETKAVKRVESTIYNENHYTTSAKTYCKDIDIDTDLLSDLDDIADEALNALSLSDNLSAVIIETVIKSFEQYILLFHSNIEFQKMSDGFAQISQALGKADIEHLDHDLQISINRFLVTLIDDVSEWKNHIFIAQDALDIHYIDDSMISNCISIASMINPVATLDDDEDDLEFF